MYDRKFCEVSQNPKSNRCFPFLNQQMAPWWRNFGGKILPFTFLLIYLIERLREYQQQLSVRKTIFSLWILVKSMGANDGLEGKTTHLAGFYIHTISGQNIPKPPIVIFKPRFFDCWHPLFVLFRILEKLS